MIDLVLDKAMFEIIVEYAYTQPDEMVLDLVPYTD